MDYDRVDDCYDNESECKTEYNDKQSRSTGASATSRKNKLQRCSVCGGLGHKSRTCELASLKMGAGAQSMNEIMSPASAADSRTVVAAYGLLTLSTSPGPFQTMKLQQQVPQLNWAPAHWQPASPRIIAA